MYVQRGKQRCCWCWCSHWLTWHAGGGGGGFSGIVEVDVEVTKIRSTRESGGLGHVGRSVGKNR